MRANTVTVLGANLLWFVTCLPRLLRFIAGCARPRATQTRVLRECLQYMAAGPEVPVDAAVSAQTRGAHPLPTPQRPEPGQEPARRPSGARRSDASRNPVAAIGRIAPAGYPRWQPRIEAFMRGEGPALTREPPSVLQPTSGSTGGAKFIPFTPLMARQMRRAIGAWIAGLYLTRPRLLFGTQYWSISPNTRASQPATRVRVGFADDTEYLGGVQKRIVRILLAVPPAVARIEDPAAFRHVTLVFLLRDRNLRLFSVWHPSFLTLLLDHARLDAAALCRDVRTGRLAPDLPIPAHARRELDRCLAPRPRRARQLEAIDFTASDAFTRVWPRLQVVSCWADGHVEPWLSDVRRIFPGVLIQPKGLVATEGWVSVPIGDRGRLPCAVNSHFLEFVESGSGIVRRVWELDRGREYTVVLSTGAGLLRYRLGDRVRVQGRFLRAPCLRFLDREGETCDRFGEKLDHAQVQDMLAQLECNGLSGLRFALLAPCEQTHRWFYGLFVEADSCPDGDWPRVATCAEEQLCAHYHYRHARRLGQLDALTVFRISGNGVEQYRDHLVKHGMKPGDVKPQRLSRRTDWPAAFRGEWVRGRAR